jgi:flagellar secretion chaperone FliS
MYRPNKYQAYQSGAVFTASPAQLVLMLYDGAIKFLNLGLEGFKYDDPLEFNLTINQNVLKAQAIIRELKACLDPEKSPEFVDKMTALYEYFDRRLQEGNIKKTPEPLHEVVRHLHLLRDAWQEMAQTQKKISVPNSGPAEPAGQWSAVG